MSLQILNIRIRVALVFQLLSFSFNDFIVGFPKTPYKTSEHMDFVLFYW